MSSEKSQLTYSILDCSSSVLKMVVEVMPNLFISYLSVEDIINLCHVSRIYRQLILKKFEQIYYCTGFCSAEQWFLVTRKICLNLVEEIFN